MVRFTLNAFVLSLSLIVGAAASTHAQDAPSTGAKERTERTRRTIDARRVSVRFEAQSLDACLEFLHEVAGLDVAVSPAAREAAKDRTVTLRLRDVTVRSCLELILGQVAAELRWTVRRGVLIVEVQRDRERDQPGVLALSDVSEISNRRPSFPAPRLGLDGLTWDGEEDGVLPGGVCFCD